jgi:hypothetical protein
LKPTTGRDVSNLFNGASGSIATSVKSRHVQDGQASIGGFDDIVKKRKETTNSLHPMTPLKTNLISSCCGEGASITVKSSRSAHDFLRAWRKYCTNANSTLSFIAEMDSKDPYVICKEYFSAEIDSDVVGDIAEALHLLVTMTALERTGLFPNEASVTPFIHSWLKALTSCGRFELSVSFLTQDRYAKLMEVCAFLGNSEQGNDEINLLVQSYHETVFKK